VAFSTSLDSLLQHVPYTAPAHRNSSVFTMGKFVDLRKKDDERKKKERTWEEPSMKRLSRMSILY